MDTTSSEGRLMLNILASFADLEADIHEERQADVNTGTGAGWSDPPN